MPTLNTSGTLSATASENTLATLTTNNTFVLVFDLLNMANGDTIIVRIKTKVLSGGTTATIYSAMYANDQGSVTVQQSVPVPSDQEFVATIERTTGANFNIPWKILELE